MRPPTSARDIRDPAEFTQFAKVYYSRLSGISVDDCLDTSNRDSLIRLTERLDTVGLGSAGDVALQRPDFSIGKISFSDQPSRCLKNGVGYFCTIWRWS